MLERLDQIDWETLDHAYGPATDMPDALWQLTSQDADTRAHGHGFLDIAVLHQGSLYPCTPKAIPFLLELSVSTQVEERYELLRFLCDVAESVWDRREGGDADAHHSDDEDWAECWREEQGFARECVAEFASGCEGLLGLLEDQDPGVRAAAGRLAGWIGRLATAYASDISGSIDPEHIGTVLDQRIIQEAEPGVQAGLAEAVGNLAQSFPDLYERLRSRLTRSHTRPLRLAAALSLLEASEPFTEPLIAALVDAAVYWSELEDVPGGSPGSPFSPDRRSIDGHLAAAALERPEVVIPSLAAWMDSGDPVVRRNAARSLSQAIPQRGWPWDRGRPVLEVENETDAMIGPAVERLREALRDHSPAVCAAAAESLLALGRGSDAEIAILTAALESDDAEAIHISIVALGRAGPAAAGAVPALMARLEYEIEHTDPSVRSRNPIHLRQALQDIDRVWQIDRRLIAEALGLIGPAAAPAIPLLVRLRKDAEGWISSAAMEALSRIAPAPEVLPTLIRASARGSQLKRITAVGGLARFGPDTEAIAALSHVVENDRESSVREAAAAALGRLGPAAASALPVLRKAATRKDQSSSAVIPALARIAAPEEAIAVLLPLLDRSDKCTYVARAFGELGDHALPAVEPMTHGLRERDATHQRAVLRALARIGQGANPQALGAASDLLSARDAHVRLEAAKSARALGSPLEVWRPILLALLDESSLHIRVSAAKVLWRAGERPERAKQVVLEGLQSDKWYDREQAARALMTLGVDAAFAAPALRQLLEPQVGNSDDRAPAAGALWLLGERTEKVRDVLTTALFEFSGGETALQVIEQLGSAAQPFIPALTALVEGRAEPSFSRDSLADQARDVLERLAPLPDP